jgi:hypothetical protein
MRKAFIGRFSAAVRKIFKDIFSDRADTTGSLGTASDGSQWEAVSKVIEVQDGKAVANYTPQLGDDGSEYPIAVIDLPTQNNIITLEDTDVGSGVALWVQTSADWWMVSIDSAYNTIPAATNYTSAPATFSGQASYSVETTYSSLAGSFTAGQEYSSTPTYSLMSAEYSAGVTNYFAGDTTYTSSTDNFSSAPNFSSSVPYFSQQPFFSSQAFSVATAYSAQPVWFSNIDAYSTASTWTISETWNRWSPYTRSGSNFTVNTAWTRSRFFTQSSNFWRNYSRRAVPLAYTGGPWTRSYQNVWSSTLGNTYSVDSTWFSALGNVWSRQDFWNLAQNWFSQINAYSEARSYTPGTVWSLGPTTYFSAAPTYSAGTTTYTTGAPNYTSQLFYTSQGGTFSSTLAFTSVTPFSSATPYSSATAYSSSTNYFASLVFSSLTTFTEGATYTSAISYTSASFPESFSYVAMLKISQSISDTVSEISSLVVSTAQTIKSIIVQTSGNQITAKAFSDVTPITQLGEDLIYNATGAIINTRYGISISKAEYNNNEIGSSVTIERS